jgi:hypothetical protein
MSATQQSAFVAAARVVHGHKATVLYDQSFVYKPSSAFSLFFQVSLERLKVLLTVEISTFDGGSPALNKLKIIFLNCPLRHTGLSMPRPCHFIGERLGGRASLLKPFQEASLNRVPSSWTPSKLAGCLRARP